MYFIKLEIIVVCNFRQKSKWLTFFCIFVVFLTVSLYFEKYSVYLSTFLLFVAFFTYFTQKVM